MKNDLHNDVQEVVGKQAETMGKQKCLEISSRIMVQVEL